MSKEESLVTIRKKKVFTGTVVSDKMNKTIIVKVRRLARHPLYKKTIAKFEKFKAHDENNSAKIGDEVAIVETRPLSRDKRWRLIEIIKKKEL